MTHIITSLCLRDGACVEVCPVECIVPGQPEDEWPWYMIDPDTCIDCGACVPECPWEAIFPEEDVPADFTAKKDQWISDIADRLPDGAAFSGTIGGHSVNVLNAKKLKGGETLDLTEAIQVNYDFYSEGPGYDARP